MPPLDPEALATVLKLAIERALAPVRERIAGVEQTLSAALTLHDRVLALEHPATDPAAWMRSGITELTAAVSALRERLLMVEAREGFAELVARCDAMAADLASMRERLAVAEVRQLQPGPAGRDGVDGRDGIGFDDFEETFDGERTFARRFVREGKVLKEYVYTVPFVIDRGVYKEGRTYERGDGVTWGGSFWIAQAPTREKPGDGATSWRLAVKAGRAGKDAA